MHEFNAPVARIYFNRGGEPQKVWSVDTGPGTVEYLTASVLSAGPVLFKDDPSVQRSDQAKAWAEVTDVRIQVDSARNVIRLYKRDRMACPVCNGPVDACDCL